MRGAVQPKRLIYRQVTELDACRVATKQDPRPCALWVFLPRFAHRLGSAARIRRA
jgi:hypothetical protein